MMIATMTVAPGIEPTASLNIWMTGKPEVSVRIKVIFSIGTLNNTAKSIPRARHPFIARLSNMERATSVLAFLTSSDICTG
jgi:hypothetical protein